MLERVLHGGGFGQTAVLERVDDAGDHGRAHVADEGPVEAAEERMRFDVRCPVFGAESLLGIGVEQRADQLLRRREQGERQDKKEEDLSFLGHGDLGRKLDLFVHDALEDVVAVGTLKRRSAEQHLVDENAKGPPVNGRAVTEAGDHL